MSLLHVRQIERFLRDQYATTFWKPELADDHNLSRLLGLHAAVTTLGIPVDDERAIYEVTDGGVDKGVDALGIDAVNGHVVAVQSKWRRDGSGSVPLAAVQRFASGVRALLDIDEGQMPECSPATHDATRRTLETPGAKLTLVLTSTAANDLAPSVQEPLDEILSVLNAGVEIPIASSRTLLQSEVHRSLTAPARSSVDLNLNLLNWGQLQEPAVAYYGRVAAFDVATWFQAHGASLFDENLRVVLPKSDINLGMTRTLLSDPARFWYYNNGITVLARQINKSLIGSMGAELVQLDLREASVVNGAQTVSAAASLLGTSSEENLRSAFVSIRCIQVPEELTALGRNVTRYANTQNVVSPQDFAFLDPQQHRLRQELSAEGQEYILRAGETPANARRGVVHVRDAAVALACASGNLNSVMFARREVSRLFDRETGPYLQLFNPSVDGLYLLRVVTLFRAFEKTLSRFADSNAAPESGIARNALHIVAHLCFSEIGKTRLADPDADITDEIEGAPATATRMLKRLIRVYPTGAYPTTLFKNTSRCEELVAALEGRQSGETAEEEPTLFDLLNEA